MTQFVIDIIVMTATLIMCIIALAICTIFDFTPEASAILGVVTIVLILVLKDFMREAAVTIVLHLKQKITRIAYFKANPECRKCEHSKYIPLLPPYTMFQSCSECTKANPENFFERFENEIRDKIFGIFMRCVAEVLFAVVLAVILIVGFYIINIPFK